jgi:hypothetical protein
MKRLSRAGCGLLIVAGLSGCVGPGLEPPGRRGQISGNDTPPTTTSAAGAPATGNSNGSAGTTAANPTPAHGSADAGTGSGAIKVDQDGGIPADDAGATHP